ncbi:hypothetical protein E1287_32025 [Actinomadura sp. KC06]|uniref:hypothetical protein n=1 Tax=Actinomadura sp. KC06 TaxID=2530369 RepID=UPI001051237A|nr:hypothetical protein [Actinomadura sp. KC06]TDD28842.1 hypothetical protein E1287_32025 [Actinomadura sp. KC06]
MPSLEIVPVELIQALRTSEEAIAGALESFLPFAHPSEELFLHMRRLLSDSAVMAEKSGTVDGDALVYALVDVRSHALSIAAAASAMLGRLCDDPELKARYVGALKRGQVRMDDERSPALSEATRGRPQRFWRWLLTRLRR